MELAKKTTILFSPALHKKLTQLAKRRGKSLGEVVRLACERELGLSSQEERVKAVEKLSRLRLPVTTPARMKQESVARPEELLP
jgi:predicted DNA-binding protein